MPDRVPPSERTSQQIEQLFSQGVPGGADLRSMLIRLAVRRIVEEAMEAEVSDAVGRGYYERGEAPAGPSGRGYRNGYRAGRLKSAEGAIEFAVPQVADRQEPFVSQVKQHVQGRSAELEELATEMFARGLSVRDVEDAFRNGEGRSLLSRTAVSEV